MLKLFTKVKEWLNCKVLPAQKGAIKLAGERVILSVDLGTTSIKQALIDENGKIMAISTREYELLTPHVSWVECPEETYWEAFKSGLAELLETSGVRGESIAALGISAQGETLFFLDENMKPLRNAIVWMDNRAGAQAEAQRERFGDELCYRRTGQVQFDPCWPAAKVMWVRDNEPEVFKRTRKIVLIEDWLIYRLTGKLVSEGSLLCSTLYWDITTKTYWKDMLDFIGIDESYLPQILEPGTAVASVTPEAAARTGLSANTIVCTGALDQAAGAIGVGNIREGILSENIGAALAICAPMNTVRFDPNRVMPLHYFGIPDMYMLHTFTTGGMAVKWFRDAFCSEERTVAEASGRSAYGVMDDEAAQVAPGCDGLVALPHLGGSMAPDVDPNAKGAFAGFTLKHTKAHFCRAIMESIGYIIRRNIDALGDMGLKFDELRSLGGGSKSPVWNQIKADIIHTPLVTTHSREAACLGAAILAGTAVGIFPDVEGAVEAFVKQKERFEPDPENAGVYDRNYELYKRLFRELKGFFGASCEGDKA